MVFSGCKDDNDEINTPPVVDKVSIAPESESFTSEGGTTEVIVTSSGEWTLTGDYDWVDATPRKGKDGDVVKFTVQPNTTQEELKGEFTFTVGKATAAFKVTCAKAEEKPVEDKVSVFPKSIDAESEGGRFEVTVTSSGDWELTGQADWVEASPLKGKDGDKVVFLVKANESLEALSTTFTFKVGEASCELPVTCKATDYFLTLTSEKEVSVPQAGKQIEVVLDSSDSYRDLTYTISSEAQSWLTYDITLAGEGDKGAKMFFTAAENTTFEGRTATITIKGTHDTPVVEIQVSQAQKDNISTPQTELNIGLEGGQLEIPVTANVTYEVQPSDSWITYNGRQGDTERFVIEASGERREGTITFKGGDAELVVKVTQKTQALIEWVVNMEDNWAGPTEWKTPSVLNNLSQFTFEATVNIADFKSTKEMTTIMGVENYFLLRLGDGQNINNKTLEVAHRNGAVIAQFELVPYMMLNKWSHFAVTFDKGQVTLYINGASYGSGRISSMSSASFGSSRAYPDSDYNRLFWVGYSYSAERGLKGKMCEVRIWNKVLSPADFKATNHFYYVDPASEGLVAYWRFNEGQGTTIKDHTANGNDLEMNKAPQWVSVSLP